MDRDLLNPPFGSSVLKEPVNLTTPPSLSIADTAWKSLADHHRFDEHNFDAGRDVQSERQGLVGNREFSHHKR